MKYNGFDVLVQKNVKGIWISWTTQQPGISSWGTSKSTAVKGMEKAIGEYLDLIREKNVRPIDSLLRHELK